MATRRNYYFTNGRVINAIDALPDGEKSKFVENCILFKIDSDEKGYATSTDIETLRRDFKSLNQNYLKVIDIIDEIVRDLSNKDKVY